MSSLREPESVIEDIDELPEEKRIGFVRSLKRKLRPRRNKPRIETSPYIVFRSGRQPENRYGIYAIGSCDLRSLYACRPLIAETMNGTCAIRYDGKISSAHTTILLQSLKGLPQELVAPSIENLKLEPGYFKPRLFMSRFRTREKGLFPKTIVAMSVLPDVLRNVYRHRTDGYLVDPGGWWFGQPMKDVLKDLSKVNWFRENFENMGKISVEDYRENLAEIIRLIRGQMDAQIFIYNSLSVTPGDQSYNYQLVEEPLSLRRRRFNLTLDELSRELNFSIVNMDRILKGEGIREQVDFAHWPWDRLQPVAHETFRIISELEVFKS